MGTVTIRILKTFSARKVGPLVLFVILAGPAATSAQYTEKFETWTASSADSWETKDLSGAPFNVPANAVVEVAVRNDSTNNPRSGGVRAVGSVLDRRFTLQEAESGGEDVVVMHVQADASSQIQHYSDVTADVDFVLLGYWECGTYVETFTTFTAGADASWQDENLNAYGVSADEIAEIVMSNKLATAARQAGVRTNNSSLSRIVDLHEPEGGGVDLATMFVAADGTANATVDLYAEIDADVDFTIVGYWSTPPGPYTELFTDVGSPASDGTWDDLDLTADGVPDNAVVEMVLENADVNEENEAGVRANGSSLARFFDLHEAEADGVDAGRMHVQTDDTATMEFYFQDVSDSHAFHLTGYWSPVLGNHDAGQESDALTQSGSETDAELFGFQLAPAGTITITQIVFRLTIINGLVDGDWAGIEIVVDDNDDGNIGGGETTTVGGSGTVSTAGGTITFSTSFAVSTATNYILRADFASLSDTDNVEISLAKTDITTTSCISGSTTPVTHTELTVCYTTKFDTWTASSADTWQTKDLSGAPFNVPANAVVEVAVRNSATAAQRSGGVRAVGSVLDRRFTLHEAEDGGSDVVVMHVQADASSQIQHYSDVTADVDFALLGYWICGTYTEAFDTFSAGASASWQDEDLCVYGVIPNGAAEIVMTNDAIAAAREAGVRTNGSALARIVDIHETEGGGVDTATMFVRADATAAATVELYAEDDADIDFYLVGYWSVAPLAYNELFVDVGSPSTDGTWEDLDLTGSGVSDSAIVEFALANDFATAENNIGVRTNGSSQARLQNLHEAEDVGSDLGRMHVLSDVTATIEFYHEDVSEAHTFRLIGYWDDCDTSIEYVISDLGAVTPAEGSLGLHINATGDVAGFDEDASGDPGAWFSECGSFTALGTLGGNDGESHGVNDAEMVVGWAHDGSGNRKAFNWTSGGGMTDLGTVSGRTDSEAQAVNASSEVVGTVVDFGSPPNNRLAFIDLPVAAYTLGAGMTSLGTLGGVQSMAMDINDSGQVVGGAQDGNGPNGRNFRPFRWANGTMTDLGTLGGDAEKVLHRGEAINSSGIVVGLSYTAGGDQHAFFWDGSMTDVGTLATGDTSWALGINNSDVVVGTSNITAGGTTYHAFVWDATNGLRDLNNLVSGTWTLTRAMDINTDGSITGFGTNPTGDVRAFLLTPSCSAGGAAAKAGLLAEGSGVTDSDGVFFDRITDFDGEPLGEIEVVNDEAGIRVDYEVFDSELVSDGSPLAVTGTSDGFEDGVAFSRTLRVAMAATQFGSTVLVSMWFTRGEIAELEATLSDLELHVWDVADDGQVGTWVPAGKTVGESEPNNIVGDSGYVEYGDGTVDYWAIRAGGGTFTVGKSASTNQPPEAPATLPPAVPRMCGIGMLPLLFMAASMFLLLRTGRRSSRTVR